MKETHRTKFIDEEPRYYEIDGRSLPSVTTITGSLSGLEFQGGLDKWKIEKGNGKYEDYAKALKMTQERGKKVHRVCEALLSGKAPSIEDLLGISGYVEAFADWMSSYPSYELTGINIIDIKTAERCPDKPYVKHKLQVVAYGRAWTEQKKGIYLETRVHDFSYGYAGTADIAIVNGKRVRYWILYLDAGRQYRFFRVPGVEVEKLYRVFKTGLKLFNLWQKTMK